MSLKRLPISPCTRHPRQQPRSRRPGAIDLLDQPGPRQCARPRVLPVRTEP
jgi:hypothetical protein